MFRQVDAEPQDEASGDEDDMLVADLSDDNGVADADDEDEEDADNDWADHHRFNDSYEEYVQEESAELMPPEVLPTPAREGPDLMNLRPPLPNKQQPCRIHVQGGVGPTATRNTGLVPKNPL